MNRFYITTTIPYVNAAPHIGHALEFVQTDTVARFQKLKGFDTYFLSGTDENAIKNVQAAEELGVSVQELVDKNSGIFRELLEALHCSTDQFIRTTEERHIKGAQSLWKATNPKDLYKKSYEGLYCYGCEQFYKKEELNEKGECIEHPGKPLEIVREENYFFKLSNYQDFLLDLIESGKLEVIPEKRKNEVLSLIKRGLEDFSVSRPATRTKKWGVPVPDDAEQTIYVWYDALANYITALGYPDAKAPLYKKYWLENENRVHILGKGVSRFHAVYWPAMLESAGLPLPTFEYVHGYITVDGKKMSKSVGNVVDPLALVKKYGADAVRYFLLREIPAYDDGDFTMKKFEERYNSDLANNLGNLFSRLTNLIAVNCNGIIPEIVESPKDLSGVFDSLEHYRFHEALGLLWEEISWANKYIDETKPWVAAKKDPKLFNEVVSNLAALLYEVAKKLSPFLPETSEIIRAALSADRIIKAEPLFPKIDDQVKSQSSKLKTAGQK